MTDERDPDRSHLGNVLVDGGEVCFEDEGRDVEVYDRIEFMVGGWVRCISKRTYNQRIYSMDDIAEIAGHTNAVEDEDWWDDE